MEIIRVCPITGKINRQEIPVSRAQIDSWKAGELIQDAMPHLTPDQREFIKTGIMPDVWESIF